MKTPWRFVLAFVGTFFVFFTAHASSFPEFPYSKKMNVVIAANGIEYNGVPTQIFQFDTELTLEELTEYYSKQWSDINKIDVGDRRILSHREGDFLQTVQIELTPYPVTHGILVSSPAFKLLEHSKAKLKKMKKAIGKGFPQLPNTEFISDIRADELVGESRSLLFSNQYDVERNLEFYLEKMKKDGWVPITDRLSNHSRQTLAMNKNGKKFNLSFTVKDGRTHGVAVFLP